VLVITPALLAGCSGPLSALDPAGPSAATAAGLWWGMFIFSVVVMLALFGLWVYAMKRDPGSVDDHQAQRIQNRWIVFGGLALPLGSITVLLAFGIPAGHSMLPLPVADQNVVTVEVTGHQWWWQVRYPDTDIELRDELYIPAGVPVDVKLTSNDVIHSFWVPRLGGKVDMIPGRTNVLRLQADEPGTYRGVCAEFCGRDHAHMTFTVEAKAPEAFAAWLEAEQNDD